MHYIYLMETIRPLNEEIIIAHTTYLRKLDELDRLVISGPFDNYPGGFVMIKALTLVEAIDVARNDPFIANGFKSYEVRSFTPATKENNYGLD